MVGKDGLPVRDLELQDFQLTDNGRKQQVSTFEIIDLEARTFEYFGKNEGGGVISKPINCFADPQDGYLDASAWLLEDRMFLPVPILITEPAVGYGAGAALVFFHELNKPDSQADGEQKKGGKHSLPPSATAVFGGGTETADRRVDEASPCLGDDR